MDALRPTSFGLYGHGISVTGGQMCLLLNSLYRAYNINIVAQNSVFRQLAAVAQFCVAQHTPRGSMPRRSSATNTN
ncbi:hypothetical protein KJY77_02965 [Canibacter sp. lx-72]|uniref:hypothetical protein n=1 Tax=Canibacter zhuwentaonis TaxID=2837491 RepID=UPI001BDCB277|nr:hypothetical protein [Canibacter zhuwentaonis]MBT1018100.1 hypothetical protein [Canibacter zhuwentaonis]